MALSLEYGTPSYPANRLRTRRSRLETQRYRRSQRDTRRTRGHFLLVQTGLWYMFSAPL